MLIRSTVVWHIRYIHNPVGSMRREKTGEEKLVCDAGVPLTVFGVMLPAPANGSIVVIFPSVPSPLKVKRRIILFESIRYAYAGLSGSNTTSQIQLNLACIADTTPVTLPFVPAVP